MIAGATRGAGGPALGRHLASTSINETVRPGGSRGLIAVGIADQVAELTGLGAHARTAQPLYHVHANPPPGRPWDDAERVRYWDLFEAEFDLASRPFAAVIHVKDGREHEHRVYLRVPPDGRAIRLDHDHSRREKISRVHEVERGEPLTPGAHNRAVIAALRRDGRHDVATAMVSAGIGQASRPRSSLTPTERQRQARTGIRQADVASATLAAWRDAGSDDMTALPLKAATRVKGHLRRILDSYEALVVGQSVRTAQLAEKTLRIRSSCQQAATAGRHLRETEALISQFTEVVGQQASIIRTVRNAEAGNATGPRFSERFEDFLAVKTTYTEQTKQQNRKTCALWTELIGDGPVTAYTGQDADRFQVLLRHCPKAMAKASSGRQPKKSPGLSDRRFPSRASKRKRSSDTCRACRSTGSS